MEGGHLLTGKWSFASGLKQGDHIHTLGIVEETGEPRIFVLPVDKAELLPDSWDVMGLRGTGSIDYTITDAFVPRLQPLRVHTRPLHGGSLDRLGIIGLAVVCHSGWAMGVGRRLFDELSELVPASGTSRLAGRLGRVQDRLRQDRSQLPCRGGAGQGGMGRRRSFGPAGHEITVRQDTLIRIALGNITGALADVANFVYLSSGTTALRKSSNTRNARTKNRG